MRKTTLKGFGLACLLSLLEANLNGQNNSDHVLARIGTNRVSITITGGERVMQANGLPDHSPGQFPRRGNPNTISAQQYSFHFPLEPKMAAQPVPARHGIFGVALNGVPFDPGTAEFWNNDRSLGWNFEAKSGFINLWLDEHNAHVQPTGAYHYHGLRTGLVPRIDGAGEPLPLAAHAARGRVLRST